MGRKNERSVDRVFPHYVPFKIGKLTRFLENVVGRADLADIMQGRKKYDVFYKVRVKLGIEFVFKQVIAHLLAVIADTFIVHARIVVFEFCGLHDSLKGIPKPLVVFVRDIGKMNYVAAYAQVVPDKGDKSSIRI